ncbi:alpha-ketoglutarate-dependent dioxygenase AlkB family protein [Ancylobacter amanitiformis]|uniref:Alkylated DNA repair protein (DNA oxidative demethylase) n=1 Tax=Ancylobacter amanitiformis TaxID=217069 RepID=A0ABU0LR23_9HYPH|nr:alpha-ketoglutarate-dependent dioxygenase AlkB [Ancylobacter amanitiformis]MDQ0511149.1 alkylated DNA repair protein (DNA oxidative demethylase) [Ancylobacter amanitiformis]
MASATPAPIEIAPGCLWWPGWLDRPGQEALAEELRQILIAAPLFTPRMPRTGKPFSVRMSNCGPLGWVSDQTGYRYQPTHPETGEPWPPFPDLLTRAWAELAGTTLAPEACLINWYAPGARMGLHQDRDEAEFSAPVLSFSLGDTALFRIGGTARKDPTRSIRLASGDALLLSGPSRLAFHGIDRILPESSTLLRQPGRINLTLRRVHMADHGEIPPFCA